VTAASKWANPTGEVEGGGVRLYADGVDAAQPQMLPSPVSIPCPLPPSSESSRASLPSPPPASPKISSSKVGVIKITARRRACVHIPSHRARSKEARGGGIRAWDNGKYGDNRGARGGEGTTKTRSRTERYGGAGSERRCKGAEAADLVKRRRGRAAHPRNGRLGRGKLPKRRRSGPHTLRRRRSPHVQRVSGDRLPEILDFLSSCNCGSSLRWHGMMLAVWLAPSSRRISLAASVSNRNGHQGHRIQLFPGSQGQKSWISSKTYS